MAEDSDKPLQAAVTSAKEPKLASIFTASSKRTREEPLPMSGENTTSESSAVTTTIESTASSSKRTKVEEQATSVVSNGPEAVVATSSTSTSVVAEPISQKMTFKWLASNPARLLHGIYGPPHFSSKVACFDVDGTLIATASGAKWPKDAKDWIFWCGKGNVQARLKEYYERGYSIVFISNQNYPPGYIKHQNFKAKMPLIAKSLGIPFRVLAATAKDEYRKPDIGMWTLLNQTYAAQGFPLDKSTSFYVGDAAGRPARHVKAPLGNGKFKTQSFVRDHSDTDKGWAKNVGITFYTPEEFFWDRKDEILAAAQSQTHTHTHTHVSGTTSTSQTES